MIYVIDYGMSNLKSVDNAIRYLGGECEIIIEPTHLEQGDKLLLPGVGAFGDAMDRLESRGFIPWLEDSVRIQKHKFLGVCLGMQLIARCSEEFGYHKGLGWIDAEVRKFPEGLRLPHMGWNDITLKKPSPLMAGIPDEGAFYFLHSYYLHLRDESCLTATCQYGLTFPAAILKDNVAAMQFHPEKSQDNGLRILENFLEW